MLTLHDIYHTQGLLAKQFPGYETRVGQAAMSQIIERAIRENKSVVIEAATGIGKGFAYLIPAILSGQKVLVSTSNKSLQDQLNQKDLPTLQKVLGLGVTWAVLKGKSNYFCLEHFNTNKREIEMELLSKDGEGYDEGRLIMQQVKQWAIEDGIADMEYCPIELPTKAKELMCCSNYATHEKDSEAAKHCYATRARIKASSADIVLINHTLLALDMNLRRKSDGKIGFLPQNPIVVIDEAHEFEKAAVLAFSDDISIFSLYHLLNWQLCKKVFPKAKRETLLKALEGVLSNYLPEKGLKGYYTEQKVDYFSGLDSVILSITDLLFELNKLTSKANKETTDMAEQIIKEGERLKERLTDISHPDNNMIRWSEAKDNRQNQPVVKLRTVPLDISPLLKDGLFARHPTVIACSATLAVGTSFALFKEQVGMPSDAFELIVESPFDYKSQALVYVFDNSQDRYFVMSELLRMAKGRAFLLFTSYKAMEDAYAIVKTDHPTFMQTNSVPRATILAEFLATENAVLFATKSFWEGVDIKGDKLKLVIIDKIPFENPKQIVAQAKYERIDAKHGKGAYFNRLYVPDACLKLKQGAGRLIRSSTDTGVIALLDYRVTSKPYGKVVMDSLPPAYRTQQLEKVEQFFDKINS